MLLKAVLVVSQLLWSTDWCTSQLTDIPPPSNAQCLPFTSVFCKDIGWENATFPNLLGISNPQTIESELSLFSQLYTTGCSNALVYFICTLYYPPCSIESSFFVTLKPCRELCQYVNCTCDATVKSFGAQWPREFHCSNFPASLQQQLCYPGTVDVNLFRDKIVLPNITGFDRPDRVYRCGDVVTTPTTEQPSSMGTERPATQACPVTQLLVGNSTPGYTNHHFSGYQGCGLPCDGSLIYDIYYANTLEVVNIVLAVISAFLVVILIFTVATAGIDHSRFPYPQRPFAFMAVCYLIINFVKFIVSVSTATGSLGGCAEDHQFVHIKLPNSVTEGNDSLQIVCILKAVILYYFQMSLWIWWITLTFCWFLAAKLKWAEEAIQRFWVLYHALGWGIPLLHIILTLSLQAVDGDFITGDCYLGNVNTVALGVGVFAPTLVYLLIGIVFLGITLHSLYDIRKQVGSPHQKGQMIKKLIIRVSVFSFVLVLPNLIYLLLLVVEMIERANWHRYTLCLSATLDEQSLLEECSLPQQPTPVAFMTVKTIIWQLQALSVFTWIMSKKTVASWKDFGITIAVRGKCREESIVSTKDTTTPHETA